MRRLREEWNGESNESVAAELEQDAGQDHRARGWRLHVRVGEPGVEREHRHLDRKGEREGAEGERLQRWVGDGAAQRDQVECAGPGAGCHLMTKGGGEDRHEHQQRADQRVEDELDRGVDAVGATPDADDQVHRDQYDLPEDVEEEEVEREEDAEHPCLQDEEANEVLLHAVLDRPEARQDADPAKQRGEHHECAGEAVNAKVVGDAEAWDP